MKILIIGAFSNYAIERYYLRYFNNIPQVTAAIFEAQNIFLKYYNQHLYNKVLFRLGNQSIYKKINEELKQNISSDQPDILLVFKGMEIFPETLEWAKALGIKIVNYNPDNPFIFSGRGSGNSNISNSVNLYNLHFTYNLDTKQKLEKHFITPVYWLPFGYDIPDEVYNTAALVKETVKTCFVGNPDKARVHFLKYLAIAGIEIDVYGNGWKKYLNHPNLTIYPPVYDDDLWFTLRKYRVQLNPLRIHNLDSHGMRTFEVPGIGGIMLAPKTSEHIQFFDEDKEAFFYEGLQEAIKKIKFLLALPEDKVNIIRDAARQRCINSQYDYKNRAACVIKVLQDQNW